MLPPETAELPHLPDIHHGSVLYRNEFVKGKPARKRVCVRLVACSDAYRTPKSVRPLTEPYLAESDTSADLSLTLNQFIEKFYFTSSRTLELKHSTRKGYKDIFRLHIKKSIGKTVLRDFKTSTAQRFFDESQSLKVLSHSTCMRIRAFLLAVFARAIQTDVWTRNNPLEYVKVGGTVSRPNRRVSTLEEVAAIMKLLHEPARTVVAVAAFTGLRSGEIRGLRWKDFDGTMLTVERSVWRTHVATPKTADSADSVPVIPLLVKILEDHAQRTTRSPENYIFAGEKKRFAIHMDNLSRRVIAPKVGNLWKGWHGFRRGLGTNLATLGVDVKVIQELLRHGSMSTTAKHYLIVDRSKATDAMQRIEVSFGQQSGNDQ